ncbi:hypothetical protein J6590_087141 [Homalodisca vitripennis]|nr:hypothetical protein J6590_087141 [Homalodisca vitripennis]
MGNESLVLERHVNGRLRCECHETSSASQLRQRDGDVTDSRYGDIPQTRSASQLRQRDGDVTDSRYSDIPQTRSASQLRQRDGDVTDSRYG